MAIVFVCTFAAFCRTRTMTGDLLSRALMSARARPHRIKIFENSCDVSREPAVG
jgi:hypothetical protein